MFRLNKRSWIPIIGWILCYGFFNNCVIAPYFHVDLVDWEQLLTSLKKMMEILKKFRAVVFSLLILINMIR